jgi:hypothetical protein
MILGFNEFRRNWKVLDTSSARTKIEVSLKLTWETGEGLEMQEIVKRV